MRKLSEAQARFAEVPMDRMEMYSILGAIYVRTCVRFEKLSLIKIVAEKAKRTTSGKQKYIRAVLVKSGLLLTEGNTSSRRYKWNTKKFGAVSLETADMVIKELMMYKRTKSNEYQRKRYATGKCYNSPQRKNKQNSLND